MANWTYERIDLGNTPLIDILLVRDFMRLSNEKEDKLVELFIGSAVDTVEADSRNAVHPATLTAVFPKGTRSVELPRGVVHSATAFAIDSDGNETEITEGVTHDNGVPGCLKLPAIDAEHESVKVVYQAGSLPLEPVLAITVMTLALHRYEHREAATADGNIKETPLGYKHTITGLDPMKDGVN